MKLVALLALGTACAFAQSPTYTKDIARIFQEKCEECHRAGTAAPMALQTWEQARPWARSIKERVAKREMPPWNIDKNVGVKHFANDRSLTDAQIATIMKWVDAGAPQGDAKDMPAARVWPKDNSWVTAEELGEPDFIVKSEPYTMPAHGQDVWWKPITPLPITEPRYVRAVEIRPGTLAGRKITHHARADLEQDDPNDLTRPPGDRGIRPAGFLMEWAVGKQNDVFPADTGKLLVPGAQVRWEMHLHAVGEEIRDNVELAVWLYPKGKEPKYRTVLTFLPGSPRIGGQQWIDIAPNSTAQFSAVTVLRQPARFDNYQPHMHLRGKAMLMEAILPSGQTQTLSYVNNFNFNWMNNYIYAPEEAPVLPAGTMIRVTSWYDNTAANRNNPDPEQWVGFGDRTVDEMSHAWVNVTYLPEADYQAIVAQRSK